MDTFVRRILTVLKVNKNKMVIIIASVFLDKRIARNLIFFW